ncbi:MAG: hypothetical protein ACRDBG_10965 [Waterburya sp.]
MSIKEDALLIDRLYAALDELKAIRSQMDYRTFNPIVKSEINQITQLNQAERSHARTTGVRLDPIYCEKLLSERNGKARAEYLAAKKEIESEGFKVTQLEIACRLGVSSQTVRNKTDKVFGSWKEFLAIDY